MGFWHDLLVLGQYCVESSVLLFFPSTTGKLIYFFLTKMGKYFNKIFIHIQKREPFAKIKINLN